LRKKRKNILDPVQDRDLKDLILDQEKTKDAVIRHHHKILEESRESLNVQGLEVNKEFQEKNKLEFMKKIKFKKDLKQKKEWKKSRWK